MKTMRGIAAVFGGAALFASVSGAAPDGLVGFKSATAAAELQNEKAFDAAVSPADMRSWLEQLSSEPNQVGSPHDKANADFMLGKFKEWGWDARIETFSVLYPTPKSEVLELVSPTPFKAGLTEGAKEGDRTSTNTAGGLPPYNAYGADGDVTADLIYVNFGMPDDYANLKRLGIDPAGKIVIARYGGGWRGLKVKLAQEHGAVGCIIYSDPHEDGYFVGDAYPKGGTRPQDGVQRGSVADITLYTGDALTPGVGATEDAQRLPISEAKVLMKIPVIPISYGDAKPFLEALGGPVAPPKWRGALPITYHVGPGPAKVHLAIASNWDQKPIYDVIAVMRGSEFPNQWVVRGNHHDGWVFGAWDPLSGNVTVMAEAQAIGALVKTGWSPKRTLVYCSWDGEEAGLLGSTEWAETHADELKRKAVLYVNSDESGRGLLFMDGSHGFQHLVNEAADSVTDPETGATVLGRLRAKTLVDALAQKPAAGSFDDLMVKAAKAGGDLPLGAMGSGSDYTPFIQHLGVSSINLGFAGESTDGGIYHSTYDSFDHYIRFGDPKFEYETALAEVAGRIVLRTAQADIIPQQLSDLADTAARYEEEIEKLVQGERDHASEVNALLESGAYKLAADPTEVDNPPEAEGAVPVIDFGVLRQAAARLRKSAKAYDDAFARASFANFDLPISEMSRLNAILQGLEQSLLSRKGLPGRPWYQHMLYAPGVYTGYGAKTMPAVREAVEQRRWSDATEYIPVIAQALDATSAKIDQATGLLSVKPKASAPPGAHSAVPPPSDS